MLAGQERGLNRMVTRYTLEGGILVGGLVLGGAFRIGPVIHAALMVVALEAVGQVFADHRAGRRQRGMARAEHCLN